MNRQLAGVSFLILFLGIMFGLVALTDIGWILAGVIGLVSGGVVGGAIAERSRG
jgi:hypothetical protein